MAKQRLYLLTDYTRLINYFDNVLNDGLLSPCDVDYLEVNQKMVDFKGYQATGLEVYIKGYPLKYLVLKYSKDGYEVTELNTLNKQGRQWTKKTQLDVYRLLCSLLRGDIIRGEIIG